MYDTCTIFCCYVISWNYTECFGRGFFPAILGCFYRFYPWNQLFVFHADQIRSFVFADNLEWNQFITRFVVFKSDSFGFLIEVSIKEGFCQNNSYFFSRISIVCLYSYVINLWAYTKCGVGWQSPRRSSPGDEIGSSPQGHFWLRIFHLELANNCCILYIPITSRLIQFVRT